MADFGSEISVKTCSKCKKTKPIDQFNRRKVSKDGYRGQCQACEREYYRNYNLNQRDLAHLRPIFDEKQSKNAEKTDICSKCGETKQISEFPVESRGRKGYRNFCKACQRNYWAEYSAQFED